MTLAQAKTEHSQHFSTEEELAKDMGLFYANPLGFVMYAFEWDTDPSLQIFELEEPWASRFNCKHGPAKWQCEYLDNLGRQIRERGFDGINAVDPILEAVSSGHGIGKSALTAMVVCFIMSTRPNSKGTITANTNQQLETKTWAEVAKWMKRCITAHWFTVTTGRGSMRMYHNKYKESWFCSAQTCKEENSEAFAGQHAVDSTSFYIFDEASAVPDKIWEVSEGGLTDGEPMWLVFGNPTRNTGRFHRCFNRLRHRWNTRKIDSREVPITNKELIQKWIDDYGEDSDFVRIRVRGVFPRAGTLQLIPSDLVEAAAGKFHRTENYQHAPVIIAADVAWEGDDQYVIVKRQGIASWILGKWRELPTNTMTFANLIAKFEDEHEADAVFVDATGVGAGVIDRLRQMGRTPLAVHFGGSADDKVTYMNKRIEMWHKLKEWLEAGGAIPDDDELMEDLVSPEFDYTTNKHQMFLERKKDMKSRGLPSPDAADALAMTFAFPVVKKKGIGSVIMPRPQRPAGKPAYSPLGYR